MANATPRKIKVTFVLPSFAGGGAERVVLTLMRHLDPARFTPHLIVLNGEGPLRDSVSGNISVTDLRQPRLRQAWRRLAAVLREAESDVVVPTISHINLAVLLMRNRLGPKTRVVVRESNTPSASLGATRWPVLYRWLYRRYCRRAAAILCPSQRVASEFAGLFSVDPDRLAVLPHPVDVEAVRGLSAPAKREAGTGLRFVAAGRLTHQKGFDRLIDLLPALPGDSHVTILGDGEDRGVLEQRARRYGVEDRVAFSGFAQNPWTYFAGADAFLLPSRWEGMPNAALEALAVGTPVIARREAGGITEIAASDDALTIVESDEAFAAAMRAAAPRRDEGPRPSLLPERFALDAVMREFEALLARVVAGEASDP